MKGRHWLVAGIICVVVGALIYVLTLFVHDPVVLQPSGSIGVQQRDLLYISSLIMLLVALPVFALLVYVARTYRATNTKATYTPKHDSNRALELLWWGIPVAIVAILSVMAWQTSHTLDPFRSIQSDERPYHVQVVALEWKWLFLYPEYKTASVGELVIPVGRPVRFDIAADAPMNSFWIPELGGQIYAMSGMNTQLHLIADTTGVFKGVSSNLSGEGFADMTFAVRAVSDDDLSKWQYEAAVSPHHLTLESYDVLATPSVTNDVTIYRLDEPQLYQKIIDIYSLSHSTMPTMNHGGDH